MFTCVFVTIFSGVTSSATSGQISGVPAKPKADNAKVIDFLLDGYQRRARPVLNESDAVKVRFGLIAQQLMWVDEEKQTMKLNTWWNVKWDDPFLSWNEDEYGGVQDVRLETEDIWLPDIECYNQVKLEPLRRRDSVVVTSSGSVTWIPSYLLTSTCKIDRTSDYQNCDVKFGSWTYNGYLVDIELESEEADLSTFVLNSEWEILGVPASRNEIFYECCPEPYLDVTYIFKLKRRTPKDSSKKRSPDVLVTSPAQASVPLQVTTPGPARTNQTKPSTAPVTNVHNHYHYYCGSDQE